MIPFVKYGIELHSCVEDAEKLRRELQVFLELKLVPERDTDIVVETREIAHGGTRTGDYRASEEDN